MVVSQVISANYELFGEVFGNVNRRYVGLFSYDKQSQQWSLMRERHVIARYVGLFSYDSSELSRKNPWISNRWLPAMSGFFHMTTTSGRSASSISQRMRDCPLCRAFFIWQERLRWSLRSRADVFRDCPLCRAFFIWQEGESDDVVKTLL